MESGFSLGSNLGDRPALLAAARDRISALPDCEMVGCSPLYETEPVGVQPQYADMAYLNAVLVVESSRTAEAWMHEIAAIENALGRVRTEDRFAPRTIDIDLLYCGDTCIDQGGVIVPHPRWAQREFVVRPLADVRPDLVLPGTDQSARAILGALPAGEKVALWAEAW